MSSDELAELKIRSCMKILVYSIFSHASYDHVMIYGDSPRSAHTKLIIHCIQYILFVEQVFDPSTNVYIQVCVSTLLAKLFTLLVLGAEVNTNGSKIAFGK